MKKITSVLLLLSVFNLFGQKNDSLKTIEEVKIISNKKLIEKKIDRMVFNLEKSAASQGTDGLEALVNTPLIRVDESQNIITISGKSSVSLMVNDKPILLSGNALFNYLKTIRSENISKIEIITTPPAKYQAQGNSGIINIILKKSTKTGFNGSITTSYTQRNYSGYSNSAVLHYQNRKWDFSLKLNYYDSAKRSEENYSNFGQESEVSKTIRKDLNKGFGPDLGITYTINEKSNAGINYSFDQYKYGMDIVNISHYYTISATRDLQTETTNRSKNPSHTFSGYYDLKMDTLGKKLSLGINYFDNPDVTNVDFTTKNLNNYTQNDVKTYSNVGLKVLSANADVEYPYKKINFETGLRFTAFHNNSTQKYADLLNGNYINNVTKSNIFNYSEKNYAAYISASKDLNEKWSSKIGLRYEYALTEGYSPETTKTDKNNYGKFFPTFYLSYKKSENHQFSLNYAKRINRPGLTALNPFKWYENTYSYSSGNAALLPSYNHNFELCYLYKNKLSTTVYFQKLINGFGQYQKLENGFTEGTYLNYYNQNNFGINITYSKTFWKTWEMMAAGNFAFNNAETFGIDAGSTKGTSTNISLHNNFILNKSKTIFCFININQMFPSSDSNVFVHNFTDLSSGFRFSFMDKKLQINATVINILASRYIGDIYFNQSSQHFNNYWDGRSFRLSLNYSFGNTKLSNRKKSIDFEEKNRAN